MRVEIKYIIESDTVFSEDLGFKQQALANAFSNKVKIDSLYTEVFRSKIKYGEDKREIEIYERIWGEVYEHFNS